MQHKIFSGSRQCRAHTPVPATRLSRPANCHLLFWWLSPPSFRADCAFCIVTVAFSPPQNTLHFYLTFILLPPLPLCNLTLLSWIKGSQHAEIFSLSGSYFFSFLIFHPKMSLWRRTSKSTFDSKPSDLTLVFPTMRAALLISTGLFVRRLLQPR